MLSKNFNQARLKLFLLIPSLLITIALATTSYIIMETKYKNYPYPSEQFGFTVYPQLVFSENVLEKGYFVAARDLIVSDERQLLQLLILGPFTKLIDLKYAHFAIIFPFLAVFLYLLGNFIQERSRSIYLAISSMAFFASIAGLQSSFWGIGSGYSDYQSMILLGISMLFLLKFSEVLLRKMEKPKIVWFRFFSFFILLTILARVTAVFYVVVIMFPVLFFVLMSLFARGNKSLALRLFFEFLLISGVGWLVTLIRFDNLVWYYLSSNVESLTGKSMLDSLWNILVLLRFFIGKWQGAVLILLLIFNLLLVVRSSKSFSLKKIKFEKTDLGIIWWVFGYLGFLLYFGYSSDIPKEVMYVFPAILILSVCPFAFIGKRFLAIKNILGIILIILAIISFLTSFRSSFQFARSPTKEHVSARKSQEEMAKVLISYPVKAASWQSFTYPDWSVPVSMIAITELGKRLTPQYTLFYNGEGYWKARFGEASQEEIASEIHEQSLNCLDLIVVLTDPAIKPSVMEPYSYQIAAKLAAKVVSDTRWKKYSEVSGDPFGSSLAIYANSLNTAAKCKINLQ